MCHNNCVWEPCLKSIISVSKQYRIVGIYLGICTKSFQLAVEALNPGVCHRSRNGNSENFAGKNVGSARSAFNDCCSCCMQCAQSLGAAKPIINKGSVSCHKADPECLCGDERFKIENVQQHAFNELAFDNVPFHLNCGNVREDDFTLPDTHYIAGK